MAYNFAIISWAGTVHFYILFKILTFKDNQSRERTKSDNILRKSSINYSINTEAFATISLL